MAFRQHLIRFENRHYVWNPPSPHRDDDAAASSSPPLAALLEYVADRTGWPVHRLQVVLTTRDDDDDDHFTVVRPVSAIRGGKGGFGSLLKSQSRQAGARATTNFGSCRDLQGRRLRHVNDAVAVRHFAEWQERVEAGKATEDDMVRALVRTSSGVPGWHLQLPAWTDISKKEHRTWQRQYRLWKRAQEQSQAQRRHDRELRESRVQHYVDQAAQATASVQASLQSALQEGLVQQQQQQSNAKRQKRERDPPSALLTLTGDVVLATNENDIWQIQTKSNFGTVGIVLDTARLQQRQSDDEKAYSYYWEIRLVTGGLCQVGWADGSFAPRSETGDGVGDDGHSYAYDGSRGIVLHDGASASYGGRDAVMWTSGDVVGCLWHRASGVLRFFHNGIDLGEAYRTDPRVMLFPAASCNPDEILELHLHRSEMVHFPQQQQEQHVIPVGDVLMTEDEVSFASAAGDVSAAKADERVPEEADAKPPAEKKSTIAPNPKAPPPRPPVAAAPLDLQEYSSVAELEELGLDRLKGGLLALGVKCGGTLTQRAERLFSLRGLDPQDFPPKLLAAKKK